MPYRLNIIDKTNKGNQPFISKDTRYIFIFNGEIYNFLELKKDLENKGSFYFKNRYRSIYGGFNKRRT